MTLSRAKIEALSEADLRRTVLIPLFEAMGFRDVREYHGPNELGKDIVMWLLDELGLREDYAVVAKPEDITGRATGRNSAGEVATQVRQALNTTFPDSITGEHRKPRKCYVVTSGEILETARNAIAAALGELMQSVRLIDGKELWRLVKKHLKGAAFEKAVEDIRKLSSELSPNWAVVTTVDDEMTTLSLKPKHPRAAELEPPELHGTIAFPDTTEGQAALAQFRKHLETGAPVKLRPPVEINLTVPDFLRPLLDTEAGGYEIHIGPRVGTGPVHLRLSMRSTSGVEATHDRLTFNVVQRGTEEATLEGEASWNFRLVFTKKGPRQLGYSANYSGMNVRLAAEAAKFERALREGGELHIYDADSGLLHGVTNVPPTAELDWLTALDEWIRLLDALVLIQATTGALLKVPDEIPTAEVERTFVVARIVSEGRRKIDLGILTTKIPNFTRESARLLLEPDDARNNGLVFRGEREETVTLLGAAIPLGHAVVVVTRYRPTEAMKERLRNFLTKGEAVGSMEFDFEPGDGATAEMVYTKWAPEELLRKLPLPDESA